MESDFPRLLMATEFPPNGGGGGAAIVRQMLKGWPVEKLCWWSCQPETHQTFGQKAAAHAVARIPSKIYPQRRWCGPKSWLLENPWSWWATGHLQATLDRWQPEVIWAIPHAWSIPPLARVLPQHPVGFHVSIHDYMDIDVYSSRFGQARCQRMVKWTEQLYGAATTRDAIGRQMLADLRARTGTDGVITRAGLEAEDFAWLQAPAENKNADTLRIAYAGSIQVEGVFPVFVAALRKIRNQLPLPVRLEFFGTGGCEQRPWFDPAWMTAHGYLPLPELSASLRQCDWGFAPMDLTDNDPRYNRFSLPTKFISYLAAGLPIITLGHPESSVVKMATAHEVGVCLTTADESALAAQLLAALAQLDPGAKYRTALRQCAAAEFDAVKMRAALHENFRHCAAKTQKNKTEIEKVESRNFKNKK